MIKDPPATIAEYIQTAPAEGQALLYQLYELLKHVAPNAEEAIKWGTPFFIEPRFLFAFSAYKAHLGFAPPAATLEKFSEELAEYKTTKNTLQVSYKERLPDDLIRRMAEYSLQIVGERKDDSFW